MTTEWCAMLINRAREARWKTESDQIQKNLDSSSTDRALWFMTESETEIDEEKKQDDMREI